MPAPENQTTHSNTPLKVLLSAGFFLIGIVTVMLGQLLPIFSARLALNDEQAGYFFIAQFSGSLAGGFVYNQFIKKFSFTRAIAFGFGLIVIGCGGINFASLPISLASVFLYGIGIGIGIPTINLLIIELNYEKSSSALSTLNFFWGVGAILCKPFIDYTGTADNFFRPVIIIAGLCLTIGLGIGFSKHHEIAKQSADDSEPIISIWKTWTAWLIAAFNFFHVGIESSLGGWLTTYEIRLTQIQQKHWLSAALAFYLLLVIGRGIAPVFFRLLRENAVLLLSLGVMFGGILMILWADSFAILILGAGLTGFGTSSVFPTNMARFTKIFGAASTRQATPMFICGSLGGAVITWLTGFTSTVFVNLKSGFTVILVSCFVLLILQTILSKIRYR